ncbi:MAG TPA: hypothetical protein VJN88_01035 [Ktedonobacterales bacterium]|nr:hypothetical protein [Ktedonobacterales bacterium]
MAFHLSLAAFAVTWALLTPTVAASPITSADSAALPAAPLTFYGADSARTNNAIASTWPQYNGAYCGIETAVAMVNYDDEVQGVGMRFGGRGAQSGIASANQHSGASRWGYATPTNAYAGVTNIAPDFGTDPRSIAYMAYNYTPNNTYYHDYIYRWQFSNGGQPSYYTQAQQATTNFARALEAWHEPISVTINGGLHSVLVTGVYAYNDPARNYPAQIASVVYRDPEAWPSASRFEVSFSTWANGNFSTPFGVYSLWSLYYGDRYTRGDGRNTNDPEPSIGSYRPTSAHPIHWFRGFTWIQRDGNYVNGAYSPDFAFTSTGALMTTP